MSLSPNDAVAQLLADQALEHAILHGPATGPDSLVTTEGGPVRTMARVLGELGLKTPFNGPVRLASTAALPACTYANGAAGVGATLTANANGALTIDGAAVAAGDRVLIRHEGVTFDADDKAAITDPAKTPHNMLAVVTAAGDGSHPFILTRDTDGDEASELSNLCIYVTAGTANIGKVFNLPFSLATIVVGTTGLLFRLTGGLGGVATEAAARLAGDATEAAARAAAIQGETARAQIVEAAARQATASGGFSNQGTRAPTTLYPLSTPFYGMANGQDVGTDIPVGVILDQVVGYMQVAASGTANVRANIWLRSATSANINAGPGAVGDTLLATILLTPAAAGLTPGAASYAPAVFKMPSPIITVAGTVLLTEFDAIDGSGARAPVGFGYQTGAAGLSQHQAGYYRNAAGGGWINYSLLTNSLSWTWQTIAPLDISGVPALGATSAALVARQAELQAALANGLAPLITQASASFYQTSANFGDFVVGIDAGTDIAVGSFVDAISADLIAPAGAINVQLKMWQRATSSSNINAGPGAIGDTLVQTLLFPLASLGLTVENAGTAVMPIAGVLVAAATTYLAEIAMVDGSGAILAMGIGYSAGSDGRQRRHGYYKTSPYTGGWQSFTSAYIPTINWLTKAFTSAAALQAGITGNAVDISDIKASLTKVSTALALRAQTTTFSMASFSRFAVGIDAGTDIAVGKIVKRVIAPMQVPSTAVNLRLNLWARSTTSMNINSAPGAFGDTLLQTVLVTVASAGLAPGVFGNVIFPLSAFTTAAGLTYLLVFDAVDGSGANTTCGIGRAADNGFTQHQRGFYATNTTPGTWITSAAGVAFAVGMYGDAYVLGSGAAPVATRDLIQGCVASASGYVVSVDLTQSSLARQGATNQFGGNVTLAAPTTGNVAGEARTLTYYAGDYTFSNTGTTGHLAYANVSSVVVKDASSGAVLVLGTDYLLDAVHGSIALAASGSNRAVTVDYAWSKRRYDVIYLDPETLTLGVVQGTERDRDIAEFVPAIGDPKRIPLLNVRVTSTAAGGLEIVSVWETENGVRRALETETMILRRLARKALRKTLGRLQKGSAISIVNYSDSINTVQGGTLVGGFATTANGVNRDTTPANLGSGIGSDVIAALPGPYAASAITELGNIDDGGGAIHYKVSMVWGFMAALEARFGSTITYKNLGIGGTTSATGNSTNGQPNLRDATRLAAMTGSGANLCVIEIGMNETGSGSTEANVVAVAQAAQTAGMDVIIVGVPRPNAQRGAGYTYASWLLTCRALRRAAFYVGAAYLDTVALYADENIGVSGLSAKDMCAANLGNHPGIYEHSLLGSALSALLLDE